MAVKLTAAEWIKLLNNIDTVLLDCDGVLWRGKLPIKGSTESVKYLKQQNKRVILLTNNSTKNRASYLAKCTGLGIPVDGEDSIVTTSTLVPYYLKYMSNKPLKDDDRVYIVGHTGIGQELDAEKIAHFGIGPDNFDPNVNVFETTRLDPKVKAVVVGFDPHFSYPKLLKACSYLRNPDCLFIATNEDERLPESSHPELESPGTGCFVKAIRTGSNRRPTTLGKPYQPIFDYLAKKFNVDPQRTLMVGDNLKTDIKFARNFGLRSMLVLSGVSSAQDLKEVAGAENNLPDFYTNCLGDIVELS